MKLNKTVTTTPIFTHEGAKAQRINAEKQLRRSVMSCMLWEKEFYEDGTSIANRIGQNIPLVAPEKVQAIAIEAREQMKLRHVPLLIARVMAMLPTHKHLVSDTLERVIQRADELSEFLAIYWKAGRSPLSKQVKTGLARAFKKFSAYQLAKYNRDAEIKLRDVLFLSHAKPANAKQAKEWKLLIYGKLPSPDTWEVELSAGADKKETFTRLINQKKLGGLALLRNLRNMTEAGVNRATIKLALHTMDTKRILPFRFIAAARYAPDFEPELERALFESVSDTPTLSGRTAILVDVSGSMEQPLSAKSDMTRMDAACGLAMVLREVCHDVSVFSFSMEVRNIPSRRGFALRDAIVGSQPHGGTFLGRAVTKLAQEGFNRLVVITDEQSHDTLPRITGRAYMVNVASAKNGVGYGDWVHLDGFSEAIVNYISAYEQAD